jgi:hypothetical protein
MQAIKPLQPAFARLPKIGSTLTRLPSLQTIKPLKPAFGALPEASVNFVKLPRLNTFKPAFKNIEPLKAVQSPFLKSLNTNFTFTHLPAPHIPKFVPYAFSVAKVNALGAVKLDTAKVNFKFTPLPKLTASQFDFTHLPLPEKIASSAFSPANLLLEATLVKSVEPVYLVEKNKVKTLALLPLVSIEPPDYLGATPQIVPHLEALENYINLAVLKTQVSGSALKLAGVNSGEITASDLIKIMQDLAQRQSLRITQSYVSPQEKYLQSYMQMRPSE